MRVKIIGSVLLKSGALSLLVAPGIAYAGAGDSVIRPQTLSTATVTTTANSQSSQTNTATSANFAQGLITASDNPKNNKNCGKNSTSNNQNNGNCPASP
jgi:hypothetical protein